ncbi:unnamed protein product, partial [Discosporangium mesarthrocarpum]
KRRERAHDKPSWRSPMCSPGSMGSSYGRSSAHWAIKARPKKEKCRTFGLGLGATNQSVSFLHARKRKRPPVPFASVCCLLHCCKACAVACGMGRSKRVLFSLS